MDIIENIRATLTKVVANMSADKSEEVITIKDFIAHGIITPQKDMKPIFRDCETAASEANAEALSLPQSISVRFDFASPAQGGGSFTFRRLRSQGY